MNRKETTYLELANETLSPAIRQLFFNEFIKQRGRLQLVTKSIAPNHYNYELKSEWIAYAITFHETTQGFEFWSNIYAKMKLVEQGLNRDNLYEFAFRDRLPVLLYSSSPSSAFQTALEIFDEEIVSINPFK